MRKIESIIVRKPVGVSLYSGDYWASLDGGALRIQKVDVATVMYTTRIYAAGNWSEVEFHWEEG